MNAIFSIAKYTVVEQIRNRLYMVIVIFGLLLIGASMAFGAIAADQEIRVIFDLGLAAIEIFGLVAAVFGAVTLVLEEMQSKTIYLILTRPLPRHSYLIGRYLGLITAVGVTIVLMAALHVTLLLLKGWEATPVYIGILPLLWLKIAITTALALFWSLFSTSTAASAVFTFFIWTLGHFGPELEHLAEKSGNTFTAGVFTVVGTLLPNFQSLNLRDFLDTPGINPDVWFNGAIHGVVYIAICLYLTAFLFKRKEF